MSFNIEDIEALSFRAFAAAAFPALRRLEGIVEDNDCHLRDSALSHTLAVARSAAAIVESAPPLAAAHFLERPRGLRSRGELLVLAAILHDIGKADTWMADSRGEGTSCPGHEAAGAAAARPILVAAGLSPGEVDSVARVILLHGEIYEVIGCGAARENLDSLGAKSEGSEPELIALSLADIRGSQLREIDGAKYERLSRLLSEALAVCSLRMIGAQGPFVAKNQAKV